MNRNAIEKLKREPHENEAGVDPETNAYWQGVRHGNNNALDAVLALEPVTSPTPEYKINDWDNNFLDALYDVAAERKRQQEKEGWTLEHDDEHTDGSLAKAGAFYALSGYKIEYLGDIGHIWPWDEVPKNKDARQNLVRAAALIIAEIERLDRITEAARQSQAGNEGAET